MIRNLKTFGTFLAVAALLILPMTACTVQQTEEGELPEVEVDVKEGNLPKYDVDAAEVTIGTKDAEIDVPKVDVDVRTEKETIKVPDVDVKMPDDPDTDDEEDGGSGV